MLKKLLGKVVIVTGAGSGIGRASAICFANQGASVVVADMNEDATVCVVDEIRSYGGDAVNVTVDVTQEEQICRMVDLTIEKYGRLDCAFNNAGIPGAIKTQVDQQTEENWQIVMNTNLTGMWLCMKYQLREILKSGGGSIVNNASVFGLTGSNKGHSPYSASKHGVIGLTKTAAFEYSKSNIRVNAICPGYTWSNNLKRSLESNPELLHATLEEIPMGRLAEPFEIAKAVLFLISDDASYITGQAIAVDGGMLL